jgi:MSHA biogenesis protein MshP
MSLIAALFIIVVLAMLGLFAMRVGASGDQDFAASLLQDRALAAARSGIEYGASRAFAGACPATTTLNLTQGAMNGFRVTVSCQAFQHNDTSSATGFYWTYNLSATAQRGAYGTSDFVSRSVAKTVAR